jgi:hypothetical protein
VLKVNSRGPAHVCETKSESRPWQREGPSFRE